MQSSSSSVAAVERASDKKIILSDSSLIVTEISDSSCNLTALVDTGSPISFIRPSVFNKYFDIPIASQSNSRENFTAVNGMPIQIVGSIKTDLALKDCPDVITKAKLHILAGDSISFDVILGSDFLRANSLRIVIDYKKKR